MKRLVLATLAFVQLLMTAGAQPLCRIKHFSANDGLAQGVVMNILQDGKGFMWFSTWNGLNKFNGYTFKNYKALPGDGCTLGNNRITFISESRRGDIWCQVYDGRAYLFDSREERFIDVLRPIEKRLKYSNIIDHIYPLAKGVAWVVCTQGNCFRVDEQQCKQGEGVTLYNAFDGSIKGEQVHHIFQDSDGDEWILANKGVSIVGKKRIDCDFPFQYINQLKGNIYLLATSGKLAVYNAKAGRMKFIKLPYAAKRFNSVNQLDAQTLAIGTDNGILLFNGQTFRQIDIRTATQPIGEVLSVHKESRGELWAFITAPGVVRIDPKSGQKQYLRTPEEEVVTHERANRNLIFEDKTGTVWVMPSQGNFSYYDRNTQTLKPYYTEADNEKSRFTPFVRAYYTDRQGNLWLTGTRGIIKMSFFPHTYTEKELDYGMETRAFLLDNQQRLWVANKKGSVRIFRPDGTLQGYLSAEGEIVPTAVKFTNKVYCFMQDKAGNIWLGSKFSGLFLLKRRNDSSYAIQQFCHDAENEYSLNSNNIYSLCQDRQGHIWVGTYGGGLNLLNPTAEGGVRFIHNRNLLKNYPDEHSMNVRYIGETPHGVIMVGTTEGLLTFNASFSLPEEIKFYRNVRQPGVATSLASNDVMHIYTDSRHTTYVTTFTGGINKVMSANTLTDRIAFKTYTVQNGMVSDLVMSMIEDTHGHLWVVSENALSRFDPQRETFDNFNSNFLQKELNFSEGIPAMNGKQQLVFGTEKGMIEVNPDELRRSNDTQPIVFTGLRIQGSVAPTGIDDMEELLLTPAQRNVSFHFATLDYIAPEEIHYAYRLEGLEKEWNEADNSRSASYINLPPGKYTLHIKSTNSDGVWGSNVRSLRITVLPTFWETGWAWLLYVVLFGLLTGSMVYVLFYIYRLRHQVDMEQQLSNIKLRFFTDISHELRTPLTLISSPVVEVLEHEELSPTARRHLTLVHHNTERMLRLVNQILDFRKIQNRKMKVLVEETELIGQVQQVMESFRLIAEEKQIDFRLQAEQEVLYAWVDRDKFEKILFNLLSNAFKYTPAGKAVTALIGTQANNVMITVIDEGVGIEAGKQKSLFQRFETLARYNILQPSSGIGLSLVKELVEMHHGTIEVESLPGLGSRFKVTLPLGREVLAQDEQVEFILNDGTAPHVVRSESVAPTATSICEDALSILIVEDNVELRTFLHNILSDKYSVTEASNGEEGLKHALQAVPDLIISDVMMPVMDGLDMVKAIKANREICHIPVILLSAKTSLDDRIAGLEQGIDDYITKPFSATYLKTRILALLRQRRLLQEMYLANLSEGKRTITGNELSPSKPQITPYDEQFMRQVMEYMEEQMDNAELTIDDFANHLLLSRTVFYRKLKSIVGLTPVDFIRDIRIKRAAQLIDSGEYNVSQIAYMTGFNDPKYFSKCFKKQIGMTPTEYKEGHTEK